MKTHPMWKTWSLSFLLTIGSTLRYFKGSHVDQPWCIWISSDVHIVAMGRILLPAADGYAHIQHHLALSVAYIYEKSLSIKVSTGKMVWKHPKGPPSPFLDQSYPRPCICNLIFSLPSYDKDELSLLLSMTNLSTRAWHPTLLPFPRILLLKWSISITGSHCQLSNIFFG